MPATPSLAELKQLLCKLHCALIISSIRSFTASIPVTLISEAVRSRNISISDALILIQQHPKPIFRVTALLELANEVSQSTRLNVIDNALDAAAAIDEPRSRSEALTNIAKLLLAEDRPVILDKAFQAALSIDDLRVRAEAQAYVGKICINGSKQPSSVRAITDESLQAEAFAELAQRSPDDEQPRLIDEALKAANCISDGLRRDEAFAGVARWSPVPNALAVARAIEDIALTGRGRSAKIAERVAPHERSALVGEALGRCL